MPTILIADDSVEWRSILAIALRTIPETTVFIAESAEQALEMTYQHRLDLLVTDVNMGAMSGLDLLLRLRATEHWPRQGAIVVSGEPAPDLWVTSTLAGAALFFQKPFSPGELRKRVVSLLDRTV